MPRPFWLVFTFVVSVFLQDANATQPYVLHFDIQDKPPLTTYDFLGNPSPPNTVNECSRLRLVFAGKTIESIDDVIEARMYDDDGDWIDLLQPSGLRELGFYLGSVRWVEPLSRIDFEFWRFEFDIWETRTFHVFPSVSDDGGTQTIDFGAPATAEFEIESCYVYYAGDLEVFDCSTVDFSMQQVVADKNGKDIDGDGNPDLFWRNQATGRTMLTRMSQSNRRTLVRLDSQSTDFHVATSQWRAIGIGDFDGDRYADVLWQKSNGQLVIYFMQGRNRIHSSTVNFVPSSDWEIRAIADFNHDGRSDIYLWNRTFGSHRIHHMDGANRVGVGASPGYRILDTRWQPIGAGDFNADGNTDLMYQLITTGRHNAHFLDSNYERIGNHATGGPLPFPYFRFLPLVFFESSDPTLIDAGVIDTNNDGISDIISRSRGTGQVFFHELLWGAEALSGRARSPFTLGQLDWELRIR